MTQGTVKEALAEIKRNPKLKKRVDQVKWDAAKRMKAKNKNKNTAVASAASDGKGLRGTIGSIKARNEYTRNL